MIEEMIPDNPIWIIQQSRYPPIRTSEDFLKARDDGRFYSIYGAIVKIDEYKNFRRGWVWGDYSQKEGWEINKANFATCYLPDDARMDDIMLMVAKLMPGRKGETDLKYIWYHLVPYEVLK